jgi:hypothetical protein
MDLKLGLLPSGKPMYGGSWRTERREYRFLTDGKWRDVHDDEFQKRYLKLNNNKITRWTRQLYDKYLHLYDYGKTYTKHLFRRMVVYGKIILT